MATLQSQLVDVGHGMLEVFRGGLGRPVVCSQHPHSAGAPAASAWLSDHTELVQVLPHGVGHSSPDVTYVDLTHGQYARDLETVRRRLGIDRWVLLGGSGGGVVDLLSALNYQDSLVGIICEFVVASIPRTFAEAGDRSLLCPHHPSYHEILDTEILRTAPREPTAFGTTDDAWVHARPDVWILFRNGVPSYAWPNEEFLPRHKAQSEEVPTWDVSQRLGEIHIPTLVVAGRLDPVGPLEYVIEVHEGIPGSELLVLDNSGHGVADADREIYQATVLRFLNQIT